MAWLPALLQAQVRVDTTRTDSTAALTAVTVTASRAVGVTGGASAVIITPSALRSSPAPLLEQALRESPFVLVRQNSRGEMEISVRGSDSRQAAVLFDGVPLTLGWDHRTDPSLIPLTGSEQMVIVRGLGSLLNGPNTLGGTIAITHDAQETPPGARVSGGVGVDQFGSTVTSLGYGQRVAEFGGGVLALRSGVAHRQRAGVALPGGAADPTARDGLRTGSDLRQLDGFASLRWSGAHGRTLGLMYSAYDAERGVAPEEHIASPRLWRYPTARRSVAMASGNTGLFRTGLGIASLEVGVGLNASDMRIETFDSRDYSTVTGTELGDERTVSTRALFTHSLGAATLRASYTGADVRYTETLLPAAPADYRQRLLSTGAEMDIPVALRTRLAVGVVHDRSTTPETGGREPGQPALDNLGWRLGVTHGARDGVQLHASASERSRFPSLRELYSGALNRFTPNPALKPETLLGLEAGVTVDRALPTTGRVTFQAIGFRHRLDDAVVRVTLSNPTRFRRINRDRIESQGVELMGGVVFGEDPERAVSVHGDATLQRIRIVDATANAAQRRAEHNPERRGRLEVGVPLPAQLRLFTTARYTGTQYCLNGDTSALDALPARTVGDIALQRTFTVRRGGPFQLLRTVLAFDNVGDTAVYDQCGLPQPGRTVRVMVTMR